MQKKSDFLIIIKKIFNFSSWLLWYFYYILQAYNKYINKKFLIMKEFILKSRSGEIIFQLQATTFKKALEKASRINISLTDAALEGHDLQGVNLKGCDLRRVNLRGANLEKANLQGCNLGKANLMGANLKKANLGWAHIHGACLIKADLTGANLDSVDRTFANFELAKV